MYLSKFFSILFRYFRGNYFLLTVYRILSNFTLYISLLPFYAIGHSISFKYNVLKHKNVKPNEKIDASEGIYGSIQSSLTFGSEKECNFNHFCRFKYVSNH